MFLFKSKRFDPLSFERRIQSVSADITNNERSLRNLRGSMAYYSSHLPVHFIIIYLSYFTFVYFMKGGQLTDIITLAKLFGFLMMLIVGYLAVCRWYGFLINRKMKWGEELKTRHGDLLIQLKEQTNFDKTKDLLVRYGDGEDIELMEKQINEIKEKKEKYKAMLADADSKGDAKAMIMADLKKNENKGTGYYQMMIDALLGDDELSPGHRYALICDNCGQHNGLAPPGKLPNEIQYICPRCGKENNVKSVQSMPSPNETEKGKSDDEEANK